MTIDRSRFDAVCTIARQAMLFHSSADALEWDERTGLPVRGGQYRAEQVAALRCRAHEIRTRDDYGDDLQALSEQATVLDPHSDQAACIRWLWRDFQRERKLPTDLVSKLSVATVRGQQAWDAARKADSFADFRPAFAEMLQLKREIGERLAEGTGMSAYEALMDEYEPDSKVDQLNPIFDDLKRRLSVLIAEIGEAKNRPNESLFRADFPIESQRSFSRRVAQWIGFDFQRGRLDETSHPFCTTLGPNDVRILTRFEKNWFPGGLYGTLHEAGHGMYEQGLREDWFGLPPGTYLSLGVHESQSRLWENQVGRSRSFWSWLHNKAVEHFPGPLSGSTVDEVYFAANEVRPSLIRVEADEATYNLHISIRFELEQALIAGSIQVDELPAAWNQAYQDCLGIKSSNDADGVLQDVHWSAGLFGYFPTYTLGNLIAAQLFETAMREIGDLETQIASGAFSDLRAWLSRNVHQPGRCYSSSQLVEKVTGTPLSSKHLMSYLESKLRPLYGI